MVVVISLALMLGAHWALLQTIAWTTMLADNLHSQSFSEAITHTFDGKHPCCLCKAIIAGKKSEQKSQLAIPLPKFEFLSAKQDSIPFPPSDFQVISSNNSFYPAGPEKPLLQPPRESFI